jgi:DmsE family decaheme c-type cytochrome
MELLQKNHPCGKLKPGGGNGLLNLWSEAIVCSMDGFMHRLEYITQKPRPGSERLTKHAFLAGWIPATLSCLIFLGLLVSAQLVHADDQQPSAVLSQSASSDPHVGIAEFVALREYARQIDSEQSNPVASGGSSNPRSENEDFVALREYAWGIGIESVPANASQSSHPHPRFDAADITAVAGHAHLAGAERADLETITETRGHHPEFAALHDYARQISGGQPGSSDTASFQIAEADNALDAFRELLRKGAQPSPAPNGVPDAAPKRPVPPAARRDPSFINAHRLGSQTCLSCHAVQAEAFSRTLMGRIGKTQPAKFDCENCHGPGSAHIQAVGCAACHGEGGISKRPGIPNLVGQDPQYLVPAMKAYTTGQRKHDLMRLVLSGLGDAEIQNIASYYARQIADRAKTPAIGDAAAGKAATALCGGCHGDRGVSIFPAWPSLAGQDAQYIADAIHGYKTGSRSKAVACAGCHGEGGVSKKPGMPSLAGMDPQYLVPAMKAYAAGDRKHGLMKALISGVDEAQLNSFAQYYARQIPARAQTSAKGDPLAGKGASALCVGCHGERDGNVSAAFPSLAGQDPTYLTGAIKAYRDKARNKTVPCAACHGERGISKTPGMPSLAGLAPQYLVAAMKAYADGQRKHAVMKGLLTEVSESELNEIALYYARQVPARAETPPVGDASTGKAVSAACAGCHGALGVSANPIWPSLAGQDARYLADALRGYKDGSRDNAMMKGFVAALNEQTINNIASYYATLAPAQPALPGGAQTPTSNRDPVLVRNNLLASLDDRTIADIASYFAGLNPARSKPSGAAVQNQGGGREPVVVRNGLVASLDESTIRNVASYYASLAPEQPQSARNAPVRADPALVSFTRPADGSSPGGIVSFRNNDPSRRVEQNDAICLGCHERGERTYWNGSTHETRGIACTECHTVMRQVSRKAALKTAVEMETCFQCHKDRRAQIFRSSHMPLREGKMTCTNCHNPHGSATEAMLKENSINDTCYKCHAEKRGPFLFEHAPVRENCLSCHDPHGSSTEYMLKVSRPRLCAECHGFGHRSLANGPRTVETFGRACQNCHTQIHGSNSPSGALLQR